MERLKEAKAKAAEETGSVEEESSTEMEAMPEMEVEGVPMTQVAYAPELTVPSTSGGVKIIFRNAKIYAEKVIIKRK